MTVHIYTKADAPLAAVWPRYQRDGRKTQTAPRKHQVLQFLTLPPVALKSTVKIALLVAGEVLHVMR